MIRLIDNLSADGLNLEMTCRSWRSSRKRITRRSAVDEKQGQIHSIRKLGRTIPGISDRCRDRRDQRTEASPLLNDYRQSRFSLQMTTKGKGFRDE